jgi:cyclopropane fatty-acyl-phospholipid synthase-like methyltransferase
MEFHERMAIQHAGHTFWNPISEEAFADVARALDLEPGARVLDIACGTGEMLLRLAEQYGATGLGVDVSSHAVERARRAKAARVPDADVEFVEAEGASYRPEPGTEFDVVMLVGASWIWKGYEGTLAALVERVRPGGLVLFGEPYWKVLSPPREYCEACYFTPET